MGQPEGDGAAGEDDEGGDGFGGVEPVPASGDEPDAVVESFDAAVVPAEPDGREDRVAMLPDGAGEPDEGFEA